MFTWKNGSCYEGEYSEGKKHGTGTYTLDDGGVYVRIYRMVSDDILMMGIERGVCR